MRRVPCFSGASSHTKSTVCTPARSIVSMTTLACPLAPNTNTPASVMAGAAGELGHGRAAGFGDAVRPQHSQHCQRQYLHVRCKRYVLDVPDVVLETLFPRERIAPVHLRPARNPRPHLVPALLARVIEGQVFH